MLNNFSSLKEIKKMISAANEIILPSRCYICGRRVWNDPICMRCLPTVTNFGHRCPSCFSPTSDDSLCLSCKLFPLTAKKFRYLWSYNGVAKRFVSTMKYHPSPKLCCIAGQILADNIENLNFEMDFNAVIPIPSSKRNLRLRGFNQCDILAQYVAKKLMIPVCYDGLIHTKRILPQASLSHRERLTNVKQAFSLRSKITGNILLVDDVVTTGATTSAAVETLLNGGANDIAVLSLIRSDSWSHFRHSNLIRKTPNGVRLKTYLNG